MFGKPLKRAIRTCMGHGGVGPLKKKLFGRQCGQVLDFGPNFYNSAPEYHKQKLLLLVLTLGHVRSDGVRWDVATYISHANRMKKDWVSIMESICDAVGWARGRGGVSKVVLVSDRSPHEFSNSTTLRFIHDSLKLLCVLAEWVFDMEYHGKDVNDGIGAAMKKMLENWCATLKSIPTDECLAFLWSHTKGKPINTTNHRKFKEYRFVLM